MKKWLLFRRVVQLAAIALLFVPLAMENPFWFGTYISSEIFSLSITDPLAALEVFLAGKLFCLSLFLSALPLLLLALVLGRMFCGWVCPVNTIVELLESIKQPGRKGTSGSYAPYLVLACVLVASLILSIPFFTTISPIGIVSRTLTFGVGIEILLIAAIIAGEWIAGRKAWCRIICPVGALYGILGRRKLLRVSLDANACTNCTKCRAVCSMCAEPGSNKPLDIMNCTNCADCVDSCAQGALKFKVILNRKGENVHHEPFESITR